MSVVLGGLISGSMYALIAFGLIVIFRTSGSVTFALGANGAVGAFVCISLSNGQYAQLPLPVAVGIGIVAAGLLSLLTYVATVYWLERAGADAEASMIVTLGVEVIVTALLQEIFGSSTYTIPLFSSSDTIKIFGFAVSISAMLIVGSALAVFVAFSFVLYRTRVGLILRMGASDSDLMQLGGIGYLWVRLAVWTIAGAAASWAVILFSNYQDISTESVTGFLLASAVAASWGGFRSIPWTIAGAVAIGVVTDLVTRFAPVTLTETASFVVLVVVFLVKQRRTAVSGNWSRVSLRNLAQRWTRPAQVIGKYRVPAEALVVTAIAIWLWLDAGGFTSSLYEMLAAYTVALTGLAITMRYGGRLSLAAPAYMAAGAYMSVILAPTTGSTGAVVLAVLITGVLGASMGLVTARMDLIYYVVLSLLLTATVPEITQLFSGSTGGSQGETTSTYFGSATVMGHSELLLVYLLLALLLVTGYALIGRSPLAARSLLVITDQRTSEASGLRSIPRLVAIEAVGASLMGLGGLLLVHSVGFVSPGDFTTEVSVTLVAAVVVGGGWTIVGVAAAAAFAVVVPQELSSLATFWPAVIYGAALIVVVISFPSGVEGWLNALYEELGRGFMRERRRHRPVSAESVRQSVERMS